jgi:hypothetical protein
VLDHDFPIKELGKIAPYGVYTVNNNVGASHDTSEFAVESISRWWETLGKHTFPVEIPASTICEPYPCGNLRIAFSTGTSKWNNVEHRLFCYITKKWQGQPLIDVQTAIDLIGTTQTATGLTVICVRDASEYGLAQKVSDEDFAAINLVKITPFESWNYCILP